MIEMTEIRIVSSKINDIHITPVVQNGGEPDLAKIKGAEFIPSLYANIFICAKKKSGKTNVIHTLLKNLVTIESEVFIISSTIYKDKTWTAIRKMLKKEDVDYRNFTSFIEPKSGVSILPDLIAGKPVSDDEGEEAPMSKKQKKLAFADPRVTLLREDAKTHMWDIGLARGNAYEQPFTFMQHPRAPKERKKPKLKAAEKIFVFDDLGQELRHDSISQLMKTNRHQHAKVILSSQWITDLHPQAIKQLDYCLLFKSFNKEKLERIHSLLDLGILYDEFEALYKYATSTPFSFLYIDVRNEQYRKNFNESLRIDHPSDAS